MIKWLIILVFGDFWTKKCPHDYQLEDEIDIMTMFDTLLHTKKGL